MKLSKPELAAITFSALLIIIPLSAAPSANRLTYHVLYENLWHRITAGTHFTDWLLALTGIGQILLLRRQAEIADQQASIQRAQQALAARPKVIFRYAELDSEVSAGDRKPRVLYRVTNTGGSTATIIKYFTLARSYKASSGPMNLDHFLKETNPSRLIAGQSFDDTIEFSMPRNQFDTAWTQIQEALVSKQNPITKIMFMGMICYLDDTGLRRQTSTWRTLDVGTLRFLPSEDPSCEYCD